MNGPCVRGYTLIELILVIVLLATLGAVAGPRFFDTDSFDARRYADELSAALRYAQKVAVASGCPVRADIGAAGYGLFQQPAAGGHCDTSSTTFDVPVRTASGEPVQGSAPGDVTTTPAGSIVFDALGRTNLGADLLLSVDGRTITVRAASGLVTSP